MNTDITFSFLTEDHLPQLAVAFDKAFADYHLKSTQSSVHWLAQRCTKNGVRFDCSVGVFDNNDEIVGFTIAGVDQYRGALSAFDVATGIIPDYRGRGIAAQMLDHMTPRLKENGVTQFYLEVLQVNEPAIKAYRKAGFEICRDFDCFKLTLDDLPERRVADGVDVRPVGIDDVLQFESTVDWPPSWENSYAAMKRVADDLTMYGSFVDETCTGVIAYYPVLNWIVSLVVSPGYRRKGHGMALLEILKDSLAEKTDEVRLVNVESTDEATKAFLKTARFEVFVSQHEMKKSL